MGRLNNNNLITKDASIQLLNKQFSADVQIGVRGEKGEKGDPGSQGASGTVTVGTTTTGAAGTDASVTNSGTASAAVLNFTIPKGDTGEQGEQGEQGEAGVGIADIELNDDYTLTITLDDGTEYTTESIRGEQGETGDTGEKGDTGDTGAAATVSVGNVSSGSTAAVTNSGTSSAAVFDFTLPKGDKGDTGNTGATGNGIASITKTGTSGLVDTYTITMTSGATSTFTVTNGQDGSGAVDSVNGQTGTVVLGAEDVGALSSSTHIPRVPDFFYIAFTYSNGTLTASESFADTANAIADGLFADAILTYGTDTYRLNAIWDDDGQAMDYIKFVTADGIYTITYTNNDLSIDTNSYSSAFDVVITEENNELTCNATMLDILNAVWQGKTLNAVFNGSSEQISLAYYIYTNEDYGYVDFYGISQNGDVGGIKYSVADGLEYKQAPYSIYNVVADGAYNDGLGNNIVNTYATKSELPTNISDLNNDAGYITLSDIPAANGVDF